ncbi:hypothetical protein H4R19_006959, partial [Coemansia spiralis]
RKGRVERSQRRHRRWPRRQARQHWRRPDAQRHVGVPGGCGVQGHAAHVGCADADAQTGAKAPNAGACSGGRL